MNPPRDYADNDERIDAANHRPSIGLILSLALAGLLPSAVFVAFILWGL